MSRHLLSAISASLALATIAPRPAHACSPAVSTGDIAIPRKGAKDVPTLVDLVVIAEFPSELAVEGAGAKVPLPKGWLVGWGVDPKTGARGNVWRFRLGELAPSTEYVATMRSSSTGSTFELTRFTTGAGYDKPTGTAAAVKSFALSRYRYRLDSLGGGDCVFNEYHGFLSLDWTLGSFPNTPAGSVMHVLTLAPKTGGTASSLVWFGDTPAAFPAPTGDRPVPLGLWHPDLDATREYCLSIAAYGYGEATPSTTSTRVCAPVAAISTPGAPVDGPATPADAGVETPSCPSGGCTVAPLGAAANHTGRVVSLVPLLALLLGRRRRR